MGEINETVDEKMGEEMNEKMGEMADEKADDMAPRHFDELAGRIEGLARALLLMAAVLEQDGTLAGAQLSGAWRTSRPDAHSPVLASAGRTLRELAQALDAARSHRAAVAGRKVPAFSAVTVV
ncbi:MAG: hypothetical protein QM617_04990 [Comamonas sp.]